MQKRYVFIKYMVGDGCLNYGQFFHLLGHSVAKTEVFWIWISPQISGPLAIHWKSHNRKLSLGSMRLIPHTMWHDVVTGSVPWYVCKTPVTSLWNLLLSTNFSVEVHMKWQPAVWWSYLQRHLYCSVSVLYVAYSTVREHSHGMTQNIGDIHKRRQNFFGPCRNFDPDLPNFYLLISCNIRIWGPLPLCPF